MRTPHAHEASVHLSRALVRGWMQVDSELWRDVSIYDYYWPLGKYERNIFATREIVGLWAGTRKTNGTSHEEEETRTHLDRV